MSQERLAQLLAEVADDVDAPHLAEASWARAGVLRRRRRVVIPMVVAVVALAIGVGSIALPRVQTRPDVTSGSATVSSTPQPGPAVVDRMPEDLPGRAGVPLPSVPDLTGAIKLSVSPVASAVALYEPVDPQTAKGGPIYVLGSDGRLRLLDVVSLKPTRDAAGNEAIPLKNGSLGPHGVTAVFAQTDKVVIVDLQTAKVREIPLPGFNEFVVWQGDAGILVGQDAAAFAVDQATAKARRLGLTLWDLATDVTGGSAAEPIDDHARLVELRSVWVDGVEREPPTMRVWSPDLSRVERQVTVDMAKLPDNYAVNEWYGRAWRLGDLVVRSGWIRNSVMSGAEGVSVVDVRTGAVVRLLDLGRNRNKGCCEALGWLDPQTVVVHTDREGIVAWDIRTGAISLVAGRFPGRVTLSDLSGP
jgi:hypothetical protein